MRAKTWKKWLGVTLVAMMVVLAGCQSIGGVNIAKVVENSLNVKSSESSQSLSVELIPRKDGAISAEDKKIIDLVNGVKLDITRAATQDPTHMSIAGNITYSGKAVPFKLGMEDMNMTVWIDGMKKPAVVSLAGGELEGELVAEIEKSQDVVRGAVQKIGAYLVKQAPVPNVATVSSVTETVYGESLNLQKLHLEIKGDEIIGLVKTLLTNMVKDDAGLREITSALYDAFYPILESQMGIYSEEGDGADFFTSLAKDKEVGSLVLYKYVKNGLDEILKDFDAQAEALLKEADAKQVLSKETGLSLDLYIDGDNQVRKQNLELTVALPDVEDMPIQKIVVRAQAQTWNINKAVKLDTIDTSKGVEKFDSYALSGKGFLTNFDKNSTAFGILKNDLGLGKTDFTVFEEDSYGSDDYYPGWWSLDGVGMVPLSYIANGFEAEVKWDAATKQIVVYDALNDITVELKIGSTTAYVNGEAKTMKQPVLVDDYDAANLPLRFIVEALGGHLQWDPDYYEFYVTSK
ncbi:copper amine oxidase N-terminal domain-containing protein [Paenibacillus guangzhouensis]|uniref:copper amine oxidase N-terminal domain-containing protein n=1 Tax=Paenibacillus guangzhouensis TaxID=1473112 RepID=UPI0012671174|nr:copper amine oxidase N-terminal domain-containing protein [Paenibacillus guangzhouensis]